MCGRRRRENVMQGVVLQAMGISQGRSRPTRGSALLFEPWIAGGILCGIVRIQVDEAALDQPVANLEHVAPSARGPFRAAGAPGPIHMFAMARSFAHHQVAAGKDPVEMGEVVSDRFDGSAYFAEQFANLVLSRRQAPLGKINL